MPATRACRHRTAPAVSWFRAASPPGRVMALALLALALLAPAAAAAPGAFNKTAPANGATGVPAGPVTLTWQASSGATSYEYCYNTSAYCGVWESTTSTSKTTVSLQAATTYVWQIRAVNAAGTTYANDATWWTFTTAPMDAPGTFNKTKPLSGVMIDSPTAVTMMWEASKGATSYQVLLQHDGLVRDLGEHDGDQPQRVGPDGGDDLLLAHPGRQPGRHDVFERRVVDLHHLRRAAGGLQEGRPGATAPPARHADPATLVLGDECRRHRATSTCVDTSNDAAVQQHLVEHEREDGNAALSGLTAGTTYSWQVRAMNAGPTATYADSGRGGASRAVALPGAFNKTSPSNGAEGQPANPMLTWGASANATSYAYCYDTTNDNACTGWTNVGTLQTASLSGLVYGVTSYWHVRANNAAGTTYANGSTSAYWSFVTQNTRPGAFNKSQPSSGVMVASPHSATISWQPSTGAWRYEVLLEHHALVQRAVEQYAGHEPGLLRPGWRDDLLLAGPGRGRGRLHLCERRFLELHHVRGPAGRLLEVRSCDRHLARHVHLRHPRVGNERPRDELRVLLRHDQQQHVQHLMGRRRRQHQCHAHLTLAGDDLLLAGACGQCVPVQQDLRERRNVVVLRDTGGGAGRVLEDGPGERVHNAGTHERRWPGDASGGANSYEYCYDTTNNDSCGRLERLSSTLSKSHVMRLSPGTTYYWQVRAVNPGRDDGRGWRAGGASARWLRPLPSTR